MRPACLLAAALVLAIGASTTARQGAPLAGVVVESVDKGSAAERAGLRPGDVLVSWARSGSASNPAARGEFRTPFDARAFEIEQLPRGGTSVTVNRDGQRIDVPLVPGFWGTAVRPSWSAADVNTYTAGVALEKTQPDDAVTAWRPLIERRSTPDDVATAAWLLARAGSAFAALENIDRADAVFEQAAALFRAPADPWLEAMVWEAEGRACQPESSLRGAPGVKLPTRGRLDAGLRAHEKAASIRTQLGRSLAAAESELLSGALVVSGARRVFLDSSAADRTAFQLAGTRIGHALGVIAVEAPDSFAHARALVRLSIFTGLNWGALSSDAFTVPDAVAAKLPGYIDARRIIESVAPTHEWLRFVLDQIYSAALNAKRLDEAESLARRTIEFSVASGDRPGQETAMRNLATVLAKRGRLPDALTTADSLRKTAADPSTVDNLMVDIAIDTHNRGDINEAIGVLEVVLARPGISTLVEKRTRMALSEWYGERGDVGAAESMLLALLDGMSDTDPAYLNTMFTLVNVDASRGDFAGADAVAKRALTAAERGSSGSADMDLRMQVLLTDARSTLAEALGDHEAAVRFLVRAVELSARETRAGLEGDRLNRQVRLAGLKGDQAAALDLALQELAITRKSEPGTESEAISLFNVGVAYVEQDQYDKAVPYLGESLALFRRFDPMALYLPDALSLLGLAEGSSGNRKDGLDHLAEAMELLEERRSRPGAGVSWGGMADSTLPRVYFYAADLLVRDGQLEKAFDTVERSRARGLLEMMATRSVRLSSTVPPPLLDERRRLEDEYGQKRAALEDLSSSRDTQAIDAARIALHTAQLRLNEVDRKIAEADPRAAAVDHPVPLTLAQARASLDPGTVLLSYLVGPYRTYVFVVTPKSANSGDSGLTVRTLDISEPDLQTAVTAFRRLIAWDADPKIDNRTKIANRATLQASSRKLYDQLVRPAEAEVGAASRVLLSLDGPLHALPFAALVRGDPSRPQYLAEWKKLHTTSSMSVYAQLQQTRRPASATGPIVAFADPAYPAAALKPADAQVQALVRTGVALTPLAGARRETNAITRLFGLNATEYVGSAATEARAAAVGSSARIIHFAVHAILDERLPLNSSLVLTIPEHPAPGEANGLLQAWEIFEHVRIDADLVTLSGCETGLGQEVTGEGLVGLSRAFLYAGARTVAASLWKVADDPTAELMTHFYGYLRKGQTKDEALRNAQLDLIQLKRPPAYWAAFTLSGDWK